MSVTFKPGDRVTCVDGGDCSLVEGRTYTVSSLLSDGCLRLYEFPTEFFTTLRFIPAAVEQPKATFGERLDPQPDPRHYGQLLDEAKSKPDNVHQPRHYARFVIEPVTFINANGLPFNIGNVIKYTCRYDAKNGLEDLQKARRYLDIHIETLTRQERVQAGEDAADVWKVAL